jgi:hypothetical protein
MMHRPDPAAPRSNLPRVDKFRRHGHERSRKNAEPDDMAPLRDAAGSMRDRIPVD